MRRGSPNTAGEYGPPPANGFNGMGMPPMGMGPMNPMMLTAGDQAQIQMSQQMQQFMAMQMQFMQMMTAGGQGPQQPQLQQQQPRNMYQRSSTMGNIPPPQGLRPGSSHQRAMSTLDPNVAPWMQQPQPRGSLFAPSIHVVGPGYAPSIAPSERSNIGLPGRYRPVSQAPLPNDKSRTSSMMSGALQGWSDTKGRSATIKTVKKAKNEDEEDDDEGWEEMRRKREVKKSAWRSKRDTTGMAEMMRFADD